MSERINFTNDEKLAMNVTSSMPFNMGTNQTVEDLLQKEKSYKFNEELDKIAEKFEGSRQKLEENAEAFGESIANIEIKPMFSRILVKPLAQNPFQRVKIENGIIVDAGLLTPKAELNPMTGKYEEPKEFIVTGVVQEVGPEVKYLQPGDVIYYRVDTAVPVPFFKQGLWSLSENQIIAVVNEGLENRFYSIK